MKRYVPHIVLATTLLVGFIIHLLPFLLYSPNPLGYDTGFYRRYLIQPFVSFPNTVVPGLGTDAFVPRVLLDVLRVFHIPTDIILYGTYLVFLLIIPLLVFLLLKRSLGKKALIGAILITLSPVQYTAYWFMFWKNMWALCLLLLAFICFEYELFLPLIAVDIALAFSHKTTAIVWLLTLGVMLFLNWRRWKEIILHILVTLACFALANPTVYGALRAAPVGIFINTSEYVALSWPFIIAACIGTWYLIQHKTFRSIIIAFTIVGVAFPLFHLPFYARIFIYSDVALMILSTYGIIYLLQKISSKNLYIKYICFCALFIILGTLVGGLWKQVYNLRPLIKESDLQQLITFSTQIPPNATILTTSDEAPWFEGWTLSHIAAPGMLQDRHNLEAWNAFWGATSTAEKITFLDSFEKPFFIGTFGGMSNLIGNPPSCVVAVNPWFMHDTCK